MNGADMDRIKVIIADDSDFVRDGMKIILDVDDEFEVLGTAGTGKEAIELARKSAPDVFLMDIQMPEMDGIEEVMAIVTRIFRDVFDDDELVRKALKNGAKGYLIKNHTPEHLKQMIKSVYNGLGVMDENVLESLASSAAGSTGENKSSSSPAFDSTGYSPRELEIIEAVADGLSNKEIAEKLFISEGTVKNYISGILSKEGLTHRTALAVYYLTGRK